MRLKEYEGGIRMKKLSAIIVVAAAVMLLSLAWGTASHVLAASSSGSSGLAIDDSGGDNLTNALKAFAVSKWGKAAFALSLLVSFGLFLWPKHRGYCIIPLVFVVLLGAYGGLVESLWTWITGWTGSSGA